MDYGYYWTSSLASPDIDGPQSASGACFNFAGWNKDKNWNVSSRYKGHSVRPVYADGGKIRVTGVSLDPTNIELNTGETSTLGATVTPSYATDKSISLGIILSITLGIRHRETKSLMGYFYWTILKNYFSI